MTYYPHTGVFMKKPLYLMINCKTMEINDVEIMEFLCNLIKFNFTLK
jgi:hypothetical protein